MPSHIYRRPGSSAALFEQYFEQSRQRFLSGVTATTGQIRSIYDKAMRDVHADIVRRLPTQPSAAHLRAIERSLDELRQQVSRDTLDATLVGLRVSTSAATRSAMLYAKTVLGNAFEARGIEAIYHAVNERAVLAFATRTRFDGLRLSDRIWLQASKWQGYVQRGLESAVARGMSAKDVARTMDQFLKTGVAQPSSLSVRRRLGIPKDVSYQSLRLARTEMASAFKEGTVLGHQRTPSYLGCKWELSAGHPFEDDCDDLASGGPNNDGIYPPGDEPMQPHPNCMCVMSPIHEDMATFADRLKDWIDNPSSDAELTRWHNDIARPFFDGAPITLPGRAPIVTTTATRTATRNVRPARARRVPRPNTVRQAANVADDALTTATGTRAAPRPADTETALRDAAEATRRAEAERLARAADEAAERARREAEALLRRLEARQDVLETRIREQGLRAPVRGVDEAVDQHEAAMRAIGRPVSTTERQQIRQSYLDAGVDDITLQERVEMLERLEDGLSKPLLDTYKALPANQRPPIAFTRRAIAGNGGTDAGEVYGHTLALYERALTSSDAAGELAYQLGRAIYRNTGIIDSAQQQQFINLVQNAATKQAATRILGTGVDRGEGAFGALFRRASRGDLTTRNVGAWPDELVEALATMEQRLPKLDQIATKVLEKRAQEAAREAAKAAAEASKRAGQAFKNVPKIGEPGKAITRNQATRFLKGSKAPITHHRTSVKRYADAIVRDGVDLQQTSTAMYGHGFYTSVQPLREYGEYGIDIAIHSRNPFIMDAGNYYSALQSLVERFDQANPRWRPRRGETPSGTVSRKIQLQALAEGYDAIEVQFGRGQSYWIGIDIRNIRVIKPGS